MSELIFLADVSPYHGADGSVTMAGVHQSLESAAMAFAEIAGACGLEFRHARSVGALSPEELETARVLVLFTIGETPWTPVQRAVIEARTSSGALGLVGVHAATDSAYSWPAFGELIGARFDGHPVTGELPITVVDRDHPATAHLPSPWRFTEELYLFRALVPDARVLLAVELGSAAGAPTGSSGPTLAPIAWCIERGPARSFYTVLGHFLAAYEDGRFLEHLRGGVAWVLDAGA
jgi:type 1 glutamine amidotransferase